MASFLSGPCASLLGKGMQALGVGIPVGEGPSRMMDSMRDFGLPVPAKTWFKQRSAARNERNCESTPREKCGRARSSSSSSAFHEDLAGQVQGIMRVVGPMMQMLPSRRNASRSADPPRTARRESEREDIRYFTPQRSSDSRTARNVVTSEPVKNHEASRRRRHKSRRHVESDDSESEEEQEASYSSRRRRPKSRRHVESDDSESEEEQEAISQKVSANCMYCSRLKSLIKLPCGRYICAKCDQNEEHDEECRKCKMPRTRNSARSEIAPVPAPVPDPVDIIDLTQDSPCNRALLRCSRNFAGADEASEDLEPIALPLNELDDVPARKKKQRKRAVIINLDETVNIDDSVNNPNPSKQLICPVCLENLADENIKAMTTQCGHVFCVDCLKKITQQKKKCSLCQRPISMSKCILLHI